MGVSRLKEVIIREGITAFFYLSLNKITQKMSDKIKYRRIMSQQKYLLDIKCSKKKQEVITDSLLFSVLCTDKSKAENNLTNQAFGGFETVVLDEKDVFQSVQDCKGAYLVILGEDYELSKECFSYAAQILAEAKTRPLLIYTDEDEQIKPGTYANPVFKPDYAPDTLRCFNYIGGFFLVEKQFFLESLQSLDTTNTYWRYEFLMDCTCTLDTKQVYHISYMLCHKVNKMTADGNRLLEMKEQWIKKHRLAAYAEKIDEMDEVRIVYLPPEKKPLVSIIIPTKDNPKLLKDCLDSILQRTDYRHYEIIVVDNGGSPEHKLQYEEILKNTGVSYCYHYEKMAFNFSRMCNIGSRLAKGSFLLLLNDDVQVMQETRKDWLERLVGQASLVHTGAVGVKLLYPGGTHLQHIGLINYKSGIAHTLSGMDDRVLQDNGRNRTDRNYICVTAACMMIEKRKFEQVGGFEEKLAVTYNDVELCFRLGKAGFYQVVREDVALCHYESLTRGEDAKDVTKLKRSLHEKEKLFLLHPEFVYRDPFYNRNQTQLLLDNGMDYIRKSIAGKKIRRRMELLPDKDLVCRVESYCEEEFLRVSGYAVFIGAHRNNRNRVELVFEDSRKEMWFVRAKRCYYPNLDKQLELDKIQMCGFTAFIDMDEIRAGHLVGIRVWNPISGRHGFVPISMTKQNA